jgi:hypothetical protein
MLEITEYSALRFRGWGTSENILVILEQMSERRLAMPSKFCLEMAQLPVTSSREFEKLDRVTSMVRSRDYSSDGHLSLCRIV